MIDKVKMDTYLHLLTQPASTAMDMRLLSLRRNMTQEECLHLDWILCNRLNLAFTRTASMGREFRARKRS